jgi:PAS domain S-box-containing protein
LRPPHPACSTGALDALSARIAVLDGRGRILAVNEAWRRFAEESPAAGSALAVGGDYLAVCERGEHGLVADAGRAASAGIRSVAEGGAERFVMDYAGASPHDGRWLQMTVTRFAAPGPVRLVVAHEDITERKQVEDRLRRSDERYRAFIEHSSEAIWRFELGTPVPITLDVDAQIDAFYRHAYLAECNDATARMYGYERAEELIGFPLADLLPRDDPANVDYLRRFVASSYRLTDGESHEHDREGRPRHFLNNLIGIVENGHLLRAWGTQRDVTERKQAEIALRDSERKLRLALEAAELAIWELRQDGSRTLSDNYASIVGAAPPTDRAFLELVHPEDRDEMVARVQRAAREGGAYRHEYRVCLPDGEERWLAGYGRVVSGEAGTPDRMTGVVMNVTARRRAEEQREEARRSMHLALEVARAGVWEWDLVADRVTGDENLARIFGLPCEDVVSSRLPVEAFFRALHPDDRTQVETRLHELFVAGGEYEMEFRVVQPACATRWLSSRGRITLDADGRAVRATGLVFDITAQKELDARLRESEQRYRSLVSATAAIVAVADREGRFATPQPAWEAYTGQPWEEHRDYGYIDALHAEDQAAAAQAWEKARGERRIFEYEARLRHAPSDSYRYCVARVVPVFDDDGSVREWVSSIADVDERRRAERLAERARAEAERANAAKDAFLATLSHELRAPLQGALGWLGLLRSGGLGAEQQAKALTTLERSVRHQAQLVNDLLDVSRIISGKLRVEPSAVDLALVLEQVRDELQLDATSKGVRLAVVSSVDGATVMGDAERLAQIFRNLVANAIKFTPSGGRVAIACETRGDEAVVTVSDTGRGIAADFLPHVFDRFSQADSSITREHGGLGLGLGIVRHLVSLHGGDVAADSPGVGQGATFRVTLPIWSRPPLARAVTPAGESRAADSLRAVRVCLVEDDNDTREVVAVLLEQAGACVTAASGARAAVELLADAPPDVIVTDLGMPGEDGFWLARHVRDSGLAVPMVALTGFADTEMRARALAEGFQAHVAKPVDPDHLVAQIRSLLDRDA